MTKAEFYKRVRNIIGYKRKPEGLLAEMGLYTDGPTGGREKWLHVEGLATAHRESVWRVPGMVFTVRGTGHVHVVAGYHDEPGQSILCYCPPAFWRPDREKMIIDRLGWICIPLNPTSELVLAALADFGTVAKCE